jgi:hypothetical protein
LKGKDKMTDADEKLRRKQRLEKHFRAVRDEFEKDIVDHQRVDELVEEFIRGERVEKITPKKPVGDTGSESVEQAGDSKNE